MADHDDHNYYTRSNRESQIPDYDVNLVEPSESVLPSFAYRRQSRDPSPKRLPNVSNSLESNNGFDPRASRALGGSSSGSGRFESSQDPHEFYRQYRESFHRRPESVYAPFDTSAQLAGGADAMAAVRQQRQSPASTRVNGYTTTPVSARWNRSMENHKTPSPVVERTAVHMNNASSRPRGDIKALVNKFNSVRDESPPAPGNPSSRSTSATHSPASSNMPTPKSFKSRTSLENRTNISALGTRPTRDSVTGKLGGGNGQSTTKARRTSQIAGSALASQSMTNLSPTGPPQLPLFGEVFQDGRGLQDPGYGIPGNRRRGSDGNLNRTSTVFMEDSAPSSSIEPSSPSAWYMGVTPNLDGINFDKPLPPKKVGIHRRSRSDFSMGPLNLARHSAGTGNPVSILSPPQEIPTPSPSGTSRPQSQSRIPISTSRRTSTQSTTSESGNSSGYRTPTRPGSSLPTAIRIPRTPDFPVTGVKTPRRSPRYRNPSPPLRSNDKLAAYVGEPSLPLKSPPLRSSRPRQSVADATTAASRSRYNAASHEKPRPPSKIPNLPPNANMEQRRQMIRRDFTKSWHEKEEERHKRQSLYMQGLAEAPMPEVPNAQRYPKPIPLPEVHDSSPESTDAYATPAGNRTPQEGPLKIDTRTTNQIYIENGDSPTLGTADFNNISRLNVESSPEPGSANSDERDTTFFHPSSQEKVPRLPSMTGDPLQRVTTPRLGVTSPKSEFDDGESIQIMLGESPDLARNANSTLDPPKTAIPRAPTPKLQTDANQQPQINQHDSTSTSMSSQVDAPWSPTSHLTGATSQDRESGNSIDDLLDSYQESEPRRLFSQSPGLARAGGWDNQKVTRMYLQSRSRRTPDPDDIQPPPPLTFRGDEDEEILQPAKMEVSPAKPIPRSKSPRMDANKDRDVFHEPTPKSSLAPPINKLDHRASLSHRNDFVDTSPSMLDWMHNHDLADESIKDVNRPQPQEDGILPDIPGGGLGIIDMTVPPMPEMPSEMPADENFVSELHSSPQRRKASLPEIPLVNELSGSPSRRPEIAGAANSPPRKPVPVKSNKSLQAIMDAKPLPEVSPMKVKKPISGQVHGSVLVKHPSISSETPPKVNGASTEQLPQDDESKRLRRRLNIIKELINTESTYGQDMTVVVDIYKGTCNVVLNSVQDERALFINAPDIVAFSTVFLDALKGAAKSVYVLPKSKRWRSKRDSSATQESSTEDQSSLHTLDLSDEEKDRLTHIGSAFLDHLPEMERVYTEFLKNSEAANAKLKALQEDEKVKVWLDECCAYAKDLTTAWSLDSLLVKPLQRVTKYPLLLKELCDVTPENHPDFVKLDNAAREIAGVSKRINEAKRRMEMVEKVTQAEKKKSKDESRLNLQKAFGRRSDKYKVPVNLYEQFQDREYNQISDKFGTHFFKLQIVMRDVEMYIVDVQGWVNKFSVVTVAMEDYFNVGSTTYPEIESKWRRFRSSIKDMQNTALMDHVNAVRKFVVDPMTTLLKLHDGPQKLMERRKKRIPDFVKYKTMKDRGEKLDKKTTEFAELFLAVNDTLKDELPKLFDMTSRLVEACLNNFVQLQLQWQSVWKRKMIQAIELAEVPRSFMDIVSDFSGDFRYTEAQTLSLGICNGSILADGTAFLPPVSQATTLIGDSRRPSTTTTEHSGRNRAVSNVTPSREDIPRSRGYSGPVTTVGPSPMLPSPDLGRPTEGFGLSSHLSVNAPRQQPGLRVRASSTASNRSPVTPETANFRHVPQPVPSTAYGRPATSTGEPTYNPAAYSQTTHLQPAMDPRYQASVQPSQPASFIPPRESSANFRSSTVFSSAMPMSDSPPPTNDGPINQEHNVLFLAASVYEFNIDRARREAGYPYLTYVAGEIFDVIAEKGELWLAKNQDDEKNQIGWIWNKHFAKLAS